MTLLPGLYCPSYHCSKYTNVRHLYRLLQLTRRPTSKYLLGLGVRMSDCRFLRYRNSTYLEAKRAAVDYQAAKRALREGEKAPFAGWLRTGSAWEEFRLVPTPA